VVVEESLEVEESSLEVEESSLEAEESSLEVAGQHAEKLPTIDEQHGFLLPKQCMTRQDKESRDQPRTTKI
jgi:hypothetical protein